MIPSDPGKGIAKPINDLALFLVALSLPKTLNCARFFVFKKRFSVVSFYGQ